MVLVIRRERIRQVCGFVFSNKAIIMRSAKWALLPPPQKFFVQHAYSVPFGLSFSYVKDSVEIQHE